MTASASPNATQQPLAILLAEDSAVSQRVLRLLLTQRGHDVDVASDGEQALAALRSRVYDLALMDFHLPKMDGLSVVTKFKSMNLGNAKRVYFIGITGDVDRLLAHPANRQMFDLVIAKPIDIIDLCNLLENPLRYIALSARGDEPPNVTPAPEHYSSGANPPRASGVEPRAYRAKIERGMTVITLGNGQVHGCHVVDLSVSGAALKVNVRPPIGEYVYVGCTGGRVVRHTDDGIAVEFAHASPGGTAKSA